MSVSPIVNTALQYFLYVVIVAAVGAAIPFVKKAWQWMLAKVPANYRPLLETWGTEAVAYIEQHMSTLSGNEKFAAAVQHVLAVASHNKINPSIQEVQGVIQRAYDKLSQSGELPQPKVTPTPEPAQPASPQA